MYNLETLKKDIADLTEGYDTEEEAFFATLDGLHDYLEEIEYTLYIGELIRAVSFYLIHSKDGDAIKHNVADALKVVVHNEINARAYNNVTTVMHNALDRQ